MSNNVELNKDIIRKKIQKIEFSLTGDMIKDMDAKDAIHRLKMKLNGITPNTNGDIECIGCGS